MLSILPPIDITNSTYLSQAVRRDGSVGPAEFLMEQRHNMWQDPPLNHLLLSADWSADYCKLNPVELTCEGGGGGPANLASFAQLWYAEKYTHFRTLWPEPLHRLH